MSGVPRGFAFRALGYFALRDLIPMYAVYALLFADYGLSTAHISSLFVVWSVTAFMFEVPSGAWADAVSRRALLGLSSLLYASGFCLWITAPSYGGFAAGFVLWGASSALMSGTFEALLYDELVALDAGEAYAGLKGFSHSLAMACNLAATLAAAPLLAFGGYRLVGWVSVGIALLQGAFAWSLPRAPQVASAQEPGLRPNGDFVRRYVSMLVDGLSEVRRRAVVRHVVMLAALVMGITAFDEFFPLLALDKGADPAVIPLLVGMTVLGQMTGTALAGWTARISGSAMARALALAAGLVVIGALIDQPLAFISIGLGYGVVSNAIIVTESRLQDAIEGPARATVTSVAGLSSEVVAVGIYCLFALGSSAMSVSATVAAIAGLMLGVAYVTPRWLPAPRPPTAGTKR
jgi:Major Facilitator Superfamily